MIQRARMALSLFLFFNLFFLDSGFAQKIFFRNYTVTDGLCANTIRDIEQDELGYMWFTGRIKTHKASGARESLSG